jgi:spore coat protein CotH
MSAVWITAAAPPHPPGNADEAVSSTSKSQPDTDALFTNGVLHVLKLDVSRHGLQSLRLNPRRYVPATLREGSSTWTNVMVRLKGGAGSFRSVDDKPGLTLNLREASGRFHGLRKFHLNNSVQDDTFLSEWIGSELFRQAGVPSGRVAHAVLELNGRRLGLYVLLESINSDLLARYFANPHGNVYSLSANADLERLEQNGGREESQGAELRALAAVARGRDLESLRTELPQRLDVPRFLSFMALETMLDHWDGYTFNVKNYLVHHDLDSGKIVFIPHDLDQLLRDPTRPVLPSARGIVSRAILRLPETRALYGQRFEQVLTSNFVAPVLVRRIDQRVAQLTPQLMRYDPRLAAGFANNSIDLKNRILRRYNFLSTTLRPGR